MKQTPLTSIQQLHVGARMLRKRDGETDDVEVYCTVRAVTQFRFIVVFDDDDSEEYSYHASPQQGGQFRLAGSNDLVRFFICSDVQQNSPTSAEPTMAQVFERVSQCDADEFEGLCAHLYQIAHTICVNSDFKDQAWDDARHALLLAQRAVARRLGN